VRGGRLLVAALGALWLVLATAFAFDEGLIGIGQRAADSFRADLKAIEIEVTAPAVEDARLADARVRIENIRTKALVQAQTLAGPVTEVTQQIAQLGPPPAEGTTETDTIAAQRKKLNDMLGQVQGAKSQLELVSVEAEQLATRVSALQRELFFKRVFEAGRSILNPLLWFDTGLGFGLLVQRLIALYAGWWQDVRNTANFAGLALIPVFLLVIAGLYLGLRGRFNRWFQSHLLANRSPDEIGRLWHIVHAMAGAFMLLIVLIAPISVALEVAGFVTPRFDLVASALIDVIFTTVIYWTLAHRVAAPRQPAWRVIDIDDAAAGRLPVLVGLAAFVSIGSQSLAAIASGLFLPITYTIGQSAIAAITLFLLLALILLTLRNQQGLPGKTPGRRVYFSWASIFAPVAWLAIAVGVVALLFGYVALATFIATQVFETAILIVVLFLLHHLSDAAVVASFDPASGFGRFLRRITGLGERAIERWGIAFRTIVDLLLAIAGLPLLFLLWTVTWVDFRSIANSAFFGFKVGDITLSPYTAVLALLILVGGVILTNLLIRWIDGRILSQTRFDKGVQDSVRKGASYAGYILAVAFALGAAGLDFSNIAIVAGALSVGIGFGLQSIINNFVSGLILLAERPVRVGDWVVLNSGEGIIRRINVRSTEIETFDSCSIIVPNSTLITEAVRNWTHGDTMGRLTVAVSVTLDADAEKVRDSLVELARQNPKVLTYPEPQVIFVRLAAWSLDFELKAHVADVFQAALVASDIRYALVRDFAEKGISLATAPAVIQAKTP
jgi:potassium-dependent mechanosensitive channel